MKNYIKLMIAMTIMVVFMSSCGTTEKVSEQSKTIKQILEEAGAIDCEQIDLSEYEKNAGISLADYESYHFYYESDGLKIEGYMSVPLSKLQDQTKSSCLIFNHGGNRDYGALDPIQTTYYAYQFQTICIASNYRGCGKSEGKDEFGGADVDDVIHLVDFCGKLSFVDSQKINMLGVSRGGMMTYEVLRNDNRVHKAVVVSGLADSFMGYEERDDMREIYMELVGGTPEDLPKEYEKRSATYWADEINTPLLIFHGTKDEKVSYDQAEKLVQKLKENGKEVIFITSDSNVHADLQKEDVQRIKEWLGD